MNKKFFTANKIILDKGSVSNIYEFIKESNLEDVLILASGSLLKLGKLDQMKNSLDAKDVKYEIVSDIESEPTIDYIENLRASLKNEYSLIIGIGGGSVLDVTKIMSVLLNNEESLKELLGKDKFENKGIETVLIPSTAGTGAEVTPNAIVTLPEEESKEGLISERLMPKLVLLDIELLTDVPKSVIAATGMDAFTHALESYISNKANILSRTYSSESIRLLSSSLKKYFDETTDEEAAEKALVGSMYGGMALTIAGTAAVHALAYPLGGKYKMTHGVANSMLLPHVMNVNYKDIIDDLNAVSKLMGLPDEGEKDKNAKAVIKQIEEWTEYFDIPQDLKEYGVMHEDLETLSISASKVTRLLDNNPLELSIKQIKDIYAKLV